MDNPTTKHPEQLRAEPMQPPGHTAEMTDKPDHGEKSYIGSGKMEGWATIVTGADSGIGRAVAIAFAREGAHVLVSYLDEHDDAQETAHWVKEAGKQAVLVPGDVGDPVHCQNLIEHAMAEFGRLDVLVNNAAMQRSHESLEEIEPREWEQTFRTNIHSHFYMARAAVPHMKPGSSIIGTTSINATSPSPHLLAYATTKGAIANFTAGLASMLAEKGIRVNAVAPGPVWTPLIPSTMPQEAVEKFGQNTPIGRPAQPAELAGAYVFLASEAASYVTGAIIPVTGGRPML